MNEPQAGDVWRYPYLWAWQAERGETEGRKTRPVTLAAVLPIDSTTTHLYLLPITGTPPQADRDALEIPATEIRRAGLTDEVQLWIIFDEHNRDTFETSFYFEPDGRIGAFSRAFRAQVAGRFLAAYRRGAAASAVERAEL